MTTDACDFSKLSIPIRNALAFGCIIVENIDNKPLAIMYMKSVGRGMTRNEVLQKFYGDMDDSDIMNDFIESLYDS